MQKVAKSDKNTRKATKQLAERYGRRKNGPKGKWSKSDLRGQKVMK